MLQGLEPPRGDGGAASGGGELGCARRVLEAWGSSGVLEVISQCVALRPPALCFPVASLTTLAPLGMGAAVAAEPGVTAAARDKGPSGGVGAPLRDCLPLRPLSTVGDAFLACKRAQLTSGDFVRAEGRPVHLEAAAAAAGPAAVRTMRKEEVLGASCAILRLQSTRKSHWQQGASSVG